MACQPVREGCQLERTSRRVPVSCLLEDIETVSQQIICNCTSSPRRTYEGGIADRRKLDESRFHVFFSDGDAMFPTVKLLLHILPGCYGITSGACGTSIACLFQVGGAH